MEKKELRRKLKFDLLKSIEETLNKNNSEVAKKIRKITLDVAKKIAKKFYKTLEASNGKPIIKGKTFYPINKTPSSKTVLKTPPAKKEIVKKIASPTKTKSKK